MIKRLAQAWGFASILLLPNYIDLTSPAGDERMRFPSVLTKLALAHLIDLLIVAAVFAALTAWLRSFSAWPKLRWGLMALLPVVSFLRNLNVFPFDIPNAVVFALSILWPAILILLILKTPRFAAQLCKFGSSLLTGFAIFALVMTWQLVQVTRWQPGPQAFSAAIPTQPPSKPRLVWILFDELAYKPVFETRDPSLNLPNFDRLRSESTLFTDMTPIGYRTTRVVPGMQLGRVVTDVEYTSDNRYLIQTEDNPHWHTFNANASLFGMAKQHGLTTSIVGWYISYCPVFSGIATDCYWSNDDAQDRGPTMLSASLAENVWVPLRVMMEQAVSPRLAWDDEAKWNAEGHIASVQDVSQHALDTIANSQADVIYLHLPTPHPPAFWDRKNAKFAVGGSYLDSLDYTDRLLGQILDVLQAQPRWAATTLIVQGDHSWRTQMWRPLPGWSAEDERISQGGQWDPRPVLLIHSPGQQNAVTVTQPTSVMHVHDVVAAQIQAMSEKKR
jgi:hypothetical protein